MAVSAHWYSQAMRSAFHKEMNVEADTIKVGLATSSYAYNQQTDRYYSVVTNELATGGGYTSGGATLTGQSVTDTGNVYTFTGSAVSWTSATFSCQVAFVYDSTPGSAATDPLISFVDMGATQTVSSATFTIQWAGSGIAQITVS